MIPNNFTTQMKGPLTQVTPKKGLNKTVKVSRERLGSLCTGLVKSKFITVPLIFSALAVGGLFLYAHFGMHAFPSNWMIEAAAVGGVALGLLVPLVSKKARQKASFELSAFLRLFPGNNYDQIINGLYLGAIPNRLQSEGEHIVNSEGVKSILSINEPFERTNTGLSVPYTDGDWVELGVTLGRMDVKDHTLLSNEELDAAADFIHEGIKKGNVYVHCRAGHGRSAMAIAAYLIKYLNYSVTAASLHIKGIRKSSTIKNKESRLIEYYKHVHQKK